MQWDRILPPLFYDDVGNMLSEEHLAWDRIQERCKFLVHGMQDHIIVCGSQEYMMFEFIDPETEQLDRAPAKMRKMRISSNGRVELKLAWLRKDRELQGEPSSMRDLRLLDEDSWLPLYGYCAHLRDMSLADMTKQMPNYVRVLTEFQRLQASAAADYSFRVHRWQRAYILNKQFQCNAVQDMMELYYAENVWQVPLGAYLLNTFLAPNFPRDATSVDCKTFCMSVVNKQSTKHIWTGCCTSCHTHSLCQKCKRQKNIVVKTCRLIRHLRKHKDFSRLTVHQFILSINDITPTHSIFDVAQTRSQTRDLY